MTSMPRPARRVAALLFGSGFCALVYQIGWLRELRLVFGVSTAASAAVLAIFIGGLGVGGLLLGRRADRHERPILLYAQLEAIVAVSAALSPLMLAFVRHVYVAAGGTQALGLLPGTIVRLLLSALVLAVPTIAMGGTLPAAARGITSPSDTRRQQTAALYAANTLGAVAGAVVSTFVWLELFGTRRTIWLAAAINALVAVCAWWADRAGWAGGARGAGQAEQAGRVSLPAHPALPAAPALPAPPAFLLVSSASVGFSFFLMELVWYRMLAPLLGGSVFTFGTILAVALLGVGLGGLAYSVVWRDRRSTLAGFASTCMLEGAAIAAGYALGDRIAILAFVLLPVGRIGFLPEVGAWTLLTFLVVLLPAIVAGYQFPLLIALAGSGREHVGRHVGNIYAANTLGAIAGSLAGGFGLLPWLTAPGAWRFAAFALFALGLATAALAAARGEHRPLGRAIGFGYITLTLLLATGPTAVWRHSGIAAGRANLNLTSSNALEDWARAERRIVRWEGEGVESSVALQATSDGYSFIVNGKSDGNAHADAATAVMQGLFGAIANPHARTALVVGMGTGSTAGWLAAVPTIDRVDVVELEPLIADVVARECAVVNHGALENPKLHVEIGDAREWLLTARSRYDVIASEPSNPFRAGVGSLFTREYYLAGRARLAEDGVFVQWIQSYEVDAPTLKAVFATFASVFPHVEVWQTLPGDLMLIGAGRPITYRVSELDERMRAEPFRTAIQSTWRAVDVSGLLAHFVANDAAVRALADDAGVRLNTDDRNIVEFGFARSLGRGRFVGNELREFARAMQSARPTLEGGPVDWDAVNTERIAFHVATRPLLAGDPAGAEPERVRQSALLLYYRDRNGAAAREMWLRQPKPPRNPTELAMMADIEADNGSDAALPFIDALRAYQPGEADTILGELRLRQGRIDEAAVALQNALRGFRTDPWGLTMFKLKAIALAEEASERQAGVADELYAALSEPFALRAADDARLMTAAFMTRVMDFAATCRPAVNALEPHVPWTASFLTLRRDCYEASHDRRFEAAAADVRTFAAAEAPAMGIMR